MGITVICQLKGKTCRKLANGQDIDYYEKTMGTRESSAPLLGPFFIICKHVYLYIQQISGERLQDHWSSGLLSLSNYFGCYGNLKFPLTYKAKSGNLQFLPFH